jgi:hypothetical protein
MKTLQEHIDEVMDWFDFDAVHKYMEATNWQWAGVSGVPSKADLRQYVRDGMTRCYGNQSRSTECGGFRIDYHRGEDKSGTWDNFHVLFVISRWYTGE